MAKQLNVNLAMTADTSKAKAELQSLQKQLNDLMLSAQKNDSSLGLSKDIQKATQMAAQLKVQLEAATGSTGKLDLTKFNDQLRKSRTSIQDYQKALTSLGPAGTQAFANLASSIMQAEVPLRRANKALDEFATSLANTARWQLSSSLLHGFMGAIQGAYRYAQDLNESLNNIRIVTGNSTEQMSKFALEANKAAKALSTTTTSYTDAALIYYQQGLSEKEVKARTDATIKMANVSRQSAEEVSSQMTAIWNNFAKGGENLEYYADVITKLGAATAASSDEIAQGLQKFAAVADTVGLSYEKATAALATVVAETRQSAEVVGTAFKTMFARFQGLQLGETLEDGVGLNKYSKALAKVGVQILDSNGELKQMDIILDDIAERWNNISNAQQVALAETVAGTRQYAQFMAIMNNYDKILANQKLGASSGGTLNQQAEIYAESWEAAQKRVKAAAQGIYKDLINDDFFITMLNGFEKALGAVDNFIKGIGGLPSLLMLIGNLVTQIFNRQIANSLQNMADNFRNFTHGTEDALKTRKDTIKEVLDIDIVKAPKNGEERGYSAAIQSQALAQQALLDNADKMTESQKKQYQILLDINKQYGQEVIQLGRAADLAKKEADYAKNRAQALIYAKSGSNIDIFKTFRDGLNDIRTNIKNIPNISEILISGRNNLKTEENNPAGYVDSLIGKLKQLGETKPFVQETIAKLTDLRDSISTDISNDVQGVNFIERIKVSLEAFENDINTNAIRDKIASIIPDGIEGKAQLVDDLTKAFMEERRSLQDLDDAIDNATQSGENLSGNMDEFQKTIPTTAQSITTMTSYITGLVTAFRSIKNLGSIWSDDSLSDSDKMVQTFSSLSMIIPIVTTLFNKDTQAVFTHIGATVSQTIATKAATEANKAFRMSFGLITVAIIAVGAAVYGLIKAYQAWKAASPEGQLKSARQELEKFESAAEDAKTAADNLASSIDAYDSAVETLNSCTKGTEEWKKALLDVNEAAKNVIKNLRGLSADEIKALYNTDNGYVEFNKDALQKYQAQINRSIYATEIAAVSASHRVDMAQIAVNSQDLAKQLEAEERNLKIRNNPYSRDASVGQTNVNRVRAINEIINNNLNTLINSSDLENSLKDLGIEIDNLSEKTIEELSNSLKNLGDQADAATEKLSLQTKLYMDQFLGTDYDQATKNVAGLNFENRKNAISDTILNAIKGYSRLDDGQDFINNYLKDFNSAQGTNWYLSSNGIQGFSKNRVFDFLDADGQHHTLTAQQVADTIAASKALEELTQSAEDAQEELSHIGNDALKSFIGSGNLEGLTRSQFTSLKNDYAGRGNQSTEEWLQNQGFSETTAKAYSKDFEKAIQIDWDSILIPDQFQNISLGMAKQLEQTLKKINAGPAGSEAGAQFVRMFNQAAAGLSEDEQNNVLSAMLNTDWSNIESIQELQVILEELGIDLENVNWDNFIKGMQQAIGYVDDFSGLEEEIENVLSILNGLEFGKSIKEEDYKTLIAYNDAWASLFQLTTDGYRFLGDTKTIIGEATDLVGSKISKLEQGAKLQSTVSQGDFLSSFGSNDSGLKGNSGFQQLAEYLGYNLDEIIAGSVNFETLKKAVNDFFGADFAENINNVKSYIASTATSFADLNQMLKDGIIDEQQYNEQSKILSKTLKDEQEAAIENAKSFDELDKMLEKAKTEGIHFDEVKLNEKIKEIAESALDGAKSLDEFDQILAELAKHGIEFTEIALGEYLIKLGEQFDNCATQILNYKNALKSGNAETIAATKDELRAAIAVNDLSKKYSLNAKTLDAHARMIKKEADSLVKVNPEMKISAEQAVELATRNERMNAGVKKLNENFDDLAKTLKDSKKTSMDYANAFYQIEDAISDLIGAADDFELPQGFLDIPENLDLIKQAAEGSQHAINELGISITSQNLSSFFDSISDQFKNVCDDIDTFKKEVMSIPNAIQQNLEALENGKTLSDVMGNDLQKGVEALNKFIIAAGYTKDQVNAMLSGIGAKADIKLVTIQQDTEVPIYETRIEPLYSQYYTNFGDDNYVSDSGSTLDPSAFSNMGYGALPMTQGYRSKTYQVGTEKMKGYTQVPQIAINGSAGNPSLSFVGVGGGGAAGGVSNTSLGGGTKTGGGGGGSSPTRSVKPYAQSSSNPYQGIEKRIDRLNSQYNKLERARKRAYGEGALNIIKQEIEKTKELANAQRDYIKAIAGNQGLNFAKIIEQGGDLGAAIKAVGGGGGQLGKAYQALLHGEKGAINITSKDTNGNEITITRDSSGINMDIQISANGIIENYADIEDSILKRYNEEVKWWNSLSGEEQQLQDNIDRMAIAEQEKDIALDQLNATQDSLDVLWDQSDKLAEIRDGLYDLNYNLLSEKIHLKVDIAERQLKFLQYQIKILGDNIYKIPEAMNKLFGGGDSVYGKLQNLANTWKDAFYEAQSLYGLDPEEGGISAADYADMIKQAQDGLYNVIDQLLDMNEQMRNYYKKALQGVLNEMQAITNQMEHQVSIVSHLRNILSLLGRETDWTAMTGLIQGQMHMQHNNYQVSRQQAAMLKGEVQHAYANLADIQASGASEDAINEFKQAVLQPAIEAAIQAEEKMYSDLEAFIQSINDLFDVFKNKALSEFEDAITGIYGSFDYLNSSMERAQSIADEYLTTTNKLYETNELMRKLAQDMDKTDSAYAKRKLKNFSDEIQQLQNREKLTKSEMDFAKARYELLLAEIALTEAQNAKSTVRLQRDNEGNYGYVYTADRDAIDNAEQNLVEKQNDLYNLALEKYNEYSQKLIQLNSEEKAALDELWTQYKEGSIASWDEYLFRRNEIVDQYDQEREALSITYYEAQKILDETAATDYHEAWASSYDAVVEKSIDSHNEITDLINEMDNTLHWLDDQRAAITAEAQLDTQGMIATVGQLTAENDKLAAEMVNNVIPKAQALLSTVNDLTAAWAKQYDQIMALIQEYMNLIDVMQQALEQLAAEQDQNQQMQDNFDYNKDYSLEMFKTYNDQTAYLQAMRDRERKIGDLEMNPSQFVFDTATTQAIIDKIYREGQQDWFTDTMNSSFKNIQLGLEQNIDDEFLRKLRAIVPGFATGGYTGEFNGGKLAFLHQKELVLNEADTANLLASVKIIRSIADAIGLRAAAANTESPIAPGFISGQGTLEQTVTIHAEFPNATNHSEIEEAFANLVNRATQFAGRISANADRE